MGEWRSALAADAPRPARDRCPMCGAAAGHRIATAEEVAAEIELRRRFFLRRLQAPLRFTDLTDVTEMTHAAAAPILRCETCDVLVRADAADPVGIFTSEHYDPRTLRLLHDVHADAYRGRAWARELLPDGAHVLELGCYAGGFLRVATEWGWRPVGVDVSRDTAAYVRSLDFTVYDKPLEECRFREHAFDGVFVWNCFEQLADPRATLLALARLLRPGGLLVIRTPDAELYRDLAPSLDRNDEHDANVQLLAYNNLLGFPYRFGFASSTLVRLAGDCGYGLEALRRDRAVRPLRDRMHGWAVEEEARIARRGWVEGAFRTMS